MTVEAIGLGALFLAVTFLLGAPTAAQAAASRGAVAVQSPVSLRLSVGYHNIYRGSAWTPVRVAVRNRGSADVSGTVEVPQAATSATGADLEFHGLYEAPMSVPAGGTKIVTLYVPGSGIQGKVTVRFLEGRSVLATSSASPIGLDNSSLLIGVLAGDPSALQWIAPAIQRQVTTHVVRLSPATIDSVPQALATFDLIVLSNVDTSQLDRAQLDALQGYVETGGSLLLVGGPTWQETLRPLPASLLPGRITGARVLPNLRGLLPLVPGKMPSGSARAVVSVVSRPGGTVLAGQSGVPLVVRRAEGQGTVEYLAFDPSLDPVRGWSRSDLTQHLVAMAAPLAISRTWSPSGFRARFEHLFQTAALTGELSNLPSSTMPFLLLFALLMLGYVIILGPVNFLLLRRIRRQSLAWITIPALGVMALGSSFALASDVRASSTVVNTVGLVTLGGPSAARPATIYMGLATPMAGDYHLTSTSAALPAPLPQLSLSPGSSLRDASMLHPSPLRMHLQEDPQTTVTFLSMRRWSMRDVTLETSVHIPGTVRSGLTLDAQGNLAGTIRNATGLDLLDPVLVAGQSVVRLQTIPAGGSVYARIEPGLGDAWQSQNGLLTQAYGGSDLSTFGDFGGFGFFGNAPSYPREPQLIDRVRNAAGMLSQVQPMALSATGDVMLIGWTEQPLQPVSVDGSTPERRDLTLVETPLSVHFPARGTFQIPAGTVGSHLVDILPRAPQSVCCAFGFGRDDTQGVTVGSGGFLTFEFDLGANRRVHFRQLTVSVSGQDGGVDRGSAYDWRTGRWVAVDLLAQTAQLRHPSRFVSADGQVLLRLESTGSLDVADPYHDVQLSGAGAVM